MAEHKIGNVYFFPEWNDFGVVCARGFGPEVFEFISEDAYILFPDDYWCPIEDLSATTQSKYSYPWLDVMEEPSREAYRMIYPDAPWDAIPELIITAKHRNNS